MKINYQFFMLPAPIIVKESGTGEVYTRIGTYVAADSEYDRERTELGRQDIVQYPIDREGVVHTWAGTDDVEFVGKPGDEITPLHPVFSDAPLIVGQPDEFAKAYCKTASALKKEGMWVSSEKIGKVFIRFRLELNAERIGTVKVIPSPNTDLKFEGTLASNPMEIMYQVFALASTVKRFAFADSRKEFCFDISLGSPLSDVLKEAANLILEKWPQTQKDLDVKLYTFQKEE